jgi:hypothetical protein
MSDKKPVEMVSIVEGDPGERQERTTKKKTEDDYEGRGVFEVRTIC